MKKNINFLAVLAISAVTLFGSCSEKQELNPSTSNDSSTPSATALTAATGNDAPSGSHFSLNIIGVPKGKSATMTTGGRIFVPLIGTCKIMLQEGATFSVIDANGTDGTAKFQLPNPDPTNTGTTRYSVFARGVGTPGGTSTTTTCATNPLTGLVVCSNVSYVAVKGTKFQNVSAELLYIYADVDGDGTVERYPLFDSRLENYYWNYDNNGMKVLQLRFYPISTTVQ